MLSFNLNILFYYRIWSWSSEYYFWNLLSSGDSILEKLVYEFCALKVGPSIFWKTIDGSSFCSFLKFFKVGISLFFEISGIFKYTSFVFYGDYIVVFLLSNYFSCLIGVDICIWLRNWDIFLLLYLFIIFCWNFVFAPTFGVLWSMSPDLLKSANLTYVIVFNSSNFLSNCAYFCFCYSKLVKSLFIVLLFSAIFSIFRPFSTIFLFVNFVKLTF